LGTAEFAYNNKMQTNTKILPFRANSGQDPCMGFELRKKEKFEKVNKFVERMQEIQEETNVMIEVLVE